MTFWSDPSMEPKRKHRWQLLMGGIEPYFCKTAGKPKMTIKVTEHVYLNHTFKYPGRVTYEDIEVTVVDPVSPDLSRTFYDVLIAAGYRLPEEATSRQTISKQDAVRSIGNIVLIQLGPGGRVIERFTLKNAWISEVDFGSYEYESEDLMEIKLKITFDYAELTNTNAAVDGIPFGLPTGDVGP